MGFVQQDHLGIRSRRGLYGASVRIGGKWDDLVRWVGVCVYVRSLNPGRILSPMEDLWVFYAVS